jgi:hypothetical protein
MRKKRVRGLRDGVIENPKEFVREIDSFCRRAKRDPASAEAAATEYFTLQEREAAREIRRNPRDPYAYLRRFECRRMLGKRQGALSDLKKAAALAPKRSELAGEIAALLEAMS